jgi:hypothetical protein
VYWYRRRRALRRFLSALSYEIQDRRTRLELAEVEERVVTSRKGMYERMVGDVLERTDVILQALDRRIEGVKARYGNELRDLRREVAELRTLLESRENRASPGSAQPQPQQAIAPEPPTGPARDVAEG